MASTDELRKEAAHLRVLLRSVTDPAASAVINEMIAELESRAKEMESGGPTNVGGVSRAQRQEMSINWHATLWRGLAAEAQTAAQRTRDGDVKLQTVMLAARYVAKAARADRAERNEQRDKAK